MSGTCRVATHAARDAPRSPAAALREARPGRGHLSERMAESSRGKDRALQPLWEARPALRQRFAAAVSQQQQAARARSGRKAQRGGQVTLATFRCASSVRGVPHRSRRCHRHATARSTEGCAARSHRLHLLEAVLAHDGVRVAAELGARRETSPSPPRDRVRWPARREPCPQLMAGERAPLRRCRREAA